MSDDDLREYCDTTQVAKGIIKTTEATDAHFSTPRCLFSGP